MHHCSAHMHARPHVYAALSHISTCIRMHALLRSAQPSVSTISGAARHMSSAAAKGGGHKNKFKLVATDLDGTFMRDAGLPPWLQVGTVCAIRVCACMHACATHTAPRHRTTIECTSFKACDHSHSVQCNVGPTECVAITLTLYNAMWAQRNVSRSLSLCTMQCGPNGMCRAHSQFGQKNIRVVQL
jgi:hypothetical protein